MQVNIVKRDAWRIPRKFVDQWMQALQTTLARCSSHSLNRREITLVFVGPGEMKALNHQFRGKNKVTDVLSFDGFSEFELGELVLCGDRIDEQAADHLLSRNEELGYLLIHGVLHLLGYEHEKGGREAKKMLALQDEVFEKLCLRFF